MDDMQTTEHSTDMQTTEHSTDMQSTSASLRSINEESAAAPSAVAAPGSAADQPMIFKKIHMNVFIDATFSMDSTAVIYRRSSAQHKVYTRTTEKHMPENGLQQTDFANGLIEIRHAHIEGLYKVFIDLFANNEASVNVWAFGGWRSAEDNDYTRIVHNARNMHEINWPNVVDELRPRHLHTALLRSLQKFCSDSLTMREVLPKDVLLEVVFATDGIDNVDPYNEPLKKSVREDMAKLQNDPLVKSTFLAAGPKTVLQMAIHQLGVNADAVLHINSQNPTAVKAAFDAVSDHLTQPVKNPQFRNAPVRYTQMERSVSSANDPHAGNHFGGFQAFAGAPPPLVLPPAAGAGAQALFAASQPPAAGKRKRGACLGVLPCGGGAGRGHTAPPDY